MPIRVKKEDVDDDDNSIDASKNNDGGGGDGNESPRRSSRKRKAVSYNEDVLLQTILQSEEDEDSDDDDDDDDDDESERAPRKRRESGSRKKNNRRTSAETKGKNSSDDDDDDDQESEDEMVKVKEEDVSDSVGSEEEEGDSTDREDGEGEPTTKKRKTKSSSYSCDHCKKSFNSREGLEYHVKNNVCRKEGNIKGSKIKKENKKRKRGTSATKYPKFRGKPKERTCSECGRVFVSIDGFKYHAAKKVCQKKPSVAIGPNDSDFCTLKQGECFVTLFGVVRVIKDDRVIPSAEPIKDKKGKMKQFQKDLSSYEKKVMSYNIQRFGQLRARRQTINALYEEDSVSQKSIFKAYLDPFQERKKIDPPEDTSVPSGACLDRIVECEWVADNRTRFLGDDREDQEETLEKPGGLGKLFLQRRLLREQYNEENAVYFCGHCGKSFTNVPSQTYHVNNRPCTNRSKREEERRTEMQLKIQAFVEKLEADEMEMQRVIRLPRPVRQPKPRSREPYRTPVYPEVLLALGFKLIPKEVNSRQVMQRAVTMMKSAKEKPAHKAAPIPASASVVAAADFASTGGDDDVDDDGDDDGDKGKKAVATQPKPVPTPAKDTKKVAKLEHPLTTMESLGRALRHEIRVADDKNLGGMYSEVYHSLGFQYPGLKPPSVKRPIKKVVILKKKKSAKSRTTKQTRIVPAPAPLPPPPPQERTPPPNHPLPPIIDPQALIDEAFAGRYPSIKRYEGEHGNTCPICKQFGQLICCDFCKNAEHWKCFRSKFTAKALEPCDAFMCHKCVGVIIARRNRAEKRRLGKVNEKASAPSSAEGQSHETEFTKHYREVAEKGRNMNELMELLRDSQNRLNQGVARMEMNNMRRQMMGEM